jgi:type II secretory ATPase GspE/PulE/Tfp pilus assembly ATPase PilB-like protein
MGVEPFLISASLISIVAQRLIRRLCPKCKERYDPGETLVSRLGINTKKIREISFYRPKGCENCLNTGYSERIGISEILTMSPLIRDLILKKARETEIKEAARKEGMKTLREDGLARASEGITSLEEILRMTVADE